MFIFREPSTNVRLTKSLFLEESYKDKTYVIYTLKDTDHNGYISLYRRYMDMADPYEINFANQYFDGWEHWQMVANATWFKPYISRWRKELNLQMKAEALARIREIAKDEGNKAAFAANKMLLEGAWESKEDKKTVGRPSKEAIREAANELFSAEQSYKEDLERLQ